MKVLNLYAGIGGNRKLWTDCEVTAVEMNPQIADVYSSYFPDDEVIVGDAHQYLLDHFEEYDFIWSSPPCPTHSRMMISGTNRKKKKYPDMRLYQEIIFLKYFFKGRYVIENVIPYYPLLIEAQKLDRHLFWANFNIGSTHGPPRQTNLNDMKKQDFLDWLGLDDVPNIYIGDNHCNIQILRNCVHPEVGGAIFNRARGILEEIPSESLGLFEST